MAEKFAERKAVEAVENPLEKLLPRRTEQKAQELGKMQAFAIEEGASNYHAINMGTVSSRMLPKYGGLGPEYDELLRRVNASMNKLL
jgi:hypothetical protein